MREYSTQSIREIRGYGQQLALGACSFSASLPAKEQSYESAHVSLCSAGDVYINRFRDDDFFSYWEKFSGNLRMISTDEFEFDPRPLSEVVLNEPALLSKVRDACDIDDCVLYPFSPTKIEVDLSSKLEIDLWGTPDAWSQIGSKSGARRLAKMCEVLVAPGLEVPAPLTLENLLDNCSELRAQGFSHAVLKSDFGISGRGNWKFSLRNGEREDLLRLIERVQISEEKSPICERGTFVLEAWMENSLSIGAHLEVTRQGAVFPISVWQQEMGDDQTSFLGSVPLAIPGRDVEILFETLDILGQEIAKLGFWGSFGPDFLWNSTDGFILSEINARVPATAFALEVARKAKGGSASVFLFRHITLARPALFFDLKEALEAEGLLYAEPNSLGRGIIPINYALSRFGEVDLLALGEDMNEAEALFARASALLCGQS